MNIHRTHRTYTDGLERVSVEGQTVGDCLRALIQQHPGLQTILFSQKGELRHHFEIYVNAESAYPHELKKPVSGGDEIHITALLAGG